MSEEMFYRCIPELNKECKKNNCYINGGECEMTICKKYSLKGLLEEIEKLNKENEQLRTALNSKESIIKEVREYILQHCEIIRFENENVDKVGKVEGIPLLEILDKENNNEDN